MLCMMQQVENALLKAERVKRITVQDTYKRQCFSLVSNSQLVCTVVLYCQWQCVLFNCTQVISPFPAIPDQVDGRGFAYHETCTLYEHTQQAYRYTLWNKLALNVSPDESTCV